MNGMGEAKPPASVKTPDHTVAAFRTASMTKQSRPIDVGYGRKVWVRRPLSFIETLPWSGAGLSGT